MAAVNRGAVTWLVRKQKVSHKWISNFPSTCLAERDFLFYNYFLGTYKIWYPGNLMPLKSSRNFFFFRVDFWVLEKRQPNS